jgi:hypothetical protein
MSGAANLTLTAVPLYAGVLPKLQYALSDLQLNTNLMCYPEMGCENGREIELARVCVK